MVEYRFAAINSAGKPITGAITADSAADVKLKIKNLAEKNQLKIQSIEKKVTFLYKARKGNDKPIKGSQKAFNKEEVVDALTRLNYQVISVNKVLLDFNPNPPTLDIVNFVKIALNSLTKNSLTEKFLLCLLMTLKIKH